MSEVSVYVEALWRDGIWPDDAPRLRELLAQTDDDPARDELRLFGTWYELMAGVPVQVPAIRGEVETLIVHKAAHVMAGILAREPAQIDASIGELSELLDRSEHDHPHFMAARAWSDLALGELAIAISDLETARRRFAALAEETSPVALRITALLRTATVAIDRHLTEVAHSLVREAARLAKVGKVPIPAERARVGWGLLETLPAPLKRKRRKAKP